MAALDTTPDAAAVQAAVLRRMTMEDRLLAALAMSDDARQLSCDGIRMRHPEYDERQVFLAFVRMLHGDQTFAKVWPREPLLAP